MASPIEGILSPLAWAQFQLNGGVKRLLGFAGIYAAVLLLANVFIYRAVNSTHVGMPLATFAGGSLSITILLSAALLVLAGAGVINKAVLRDFNSDMLTSHRSTAMTGRIAVLGYLTGSPSTILAMTVINWVACTILAWLAGHPIYAPGFVFVMLLVLAALIWTGAVLTALSYRGKLSFVAMLVPLFIIMANDELTHMLGAHPGLALLMNLRILSSLQSAATTGLTSTDAQAVIVSMLFQGMFALAFFIAASRKYLRDDVTAFTPTLAFAVVALWALVSAVGFERFAPGSSVPPQMTVVHVSPGSQPAVSGVPYAGPPGSHPSMAAMPGYQPPVRDSGMDIAANQFFASVQAFALLAILPVANAAMNMVVWSRRKKKDRLFTGPRPRPVWEAAFAATILSFGIFILISRPKLKEIFAANALLDETSLSLWPAVGYAMLAFFLAMLALGGLLRFSYAYVKRATWIVAIFILLAWAAPLIGDLTLEAAGDRGPGAPRSALFAMSPVGLWLVVIAGHDAPIQVGLIVQAVLAGGMMLLGRRARF
ncbi:MAG TPA: hypothetical protein VNT79_13760 [Phycisphaerae bacterium]|nr:hypothetical protein [Phycisphaerae bacterium]